MNKTKKRIFELFVALFVFTGLGFTCFSLWDFISAKLEKSYPILVDVSNAGGLREGSPVRLAGLEVGRVSAKPYFKTNYTGLLVPLLIDDGIQIPANAIALVDNVDGQSLIRIELPKEEPSEFVVENDILNGFQINRQELQEKSINNSLTKVQESMKSLESTSSSLDRLVALLEGATGAASSTTGNNPLIPSLGTGDGTNLNQSLANFDKSNERVVQTLDRVDALLMQSDEDSESIAASITNFNETMDKVSSMAESGEQSFEQIGTATENNDDTIVQFQEALTEFQKLSREMNPILASVRTSEGLVKTMIEDREFDHDVRSFVDKVERKGFLHYPKETYIRATPVKSNFSRRHQ